PDFPDQEVVIGGSLSDKGRTELCSILEKNFDIFAWQPSNMTGVPRLNIRDGYSLVRQKKRGQTPECARAIQAEVMVKKHDGSWRICVDFTDLNKACPQDCYPLPEIDWKVESLCGYPFKCFLDAYKGYHQIQLAEVDEEKTTFHTGHGNIEVYVDALVVKSYTEAEMMRDIEEIFCTLRKCGPDDRTRNGPDANLLYKPRVTGSGTKLLTDGETGLVTGHVSSRRGRTATKRSIILGEHNITYRPRTSVKGQILVDFLIEMSGDVSQAVPVAVTQEEPWTLFTDGSSCVDGS
nr:reverse transcriptase domain-containing protein [Tanacetum cinerariifolium]